MPGHEKQPLKPPVSQKPKRLAKETGPFAKSHYEQTTLAASVTEQVPVNQTSVSSSPSTSISTQSSSIDVQQQPPVANTTSSSSSSSQQRMANLLPPLDQSRPFQVGTVKAVSNYPKVSPKPHPKNRNYQTLFLHPLLFCGKKSSRHSLPPKASSFDSAMTSSDSPTIPKRLSVDSGVVTSRPRRQDYEPRLPGIRQKLGVKQTAGVR